MQVLVVLEHGGVCMTGIDEALERGELRGVALGADWLHIGDPTALAAAEARLA